MKLNQILCRALGFVAVPCVLLPCVSLVGVGNLRAADLWYNGDLDQRSALTDETESPDGLVYDNFVVPTATLFTITSVFSNNAMLNTSPDAVVARWEIRSGMSPGNGGTVAASGDDTETLTNTGSSMTIGGQPVPVYTNQIVGLNVVLGAGTYWLSVAPNTNLQNSFIVTTSGAGAIGTPPGNDGDSFFASSFFNSNFDATSNPAVLGAGTWDFSMGIVGTATVLPEPSSAVLGLMGIIAIGGCARPRRRWRC